MLDPVASSDRRTPAPAALSSPKIFFAASLPDAWICGSGASSGVAAEVDDGVAQPREVDVLAVDHVLVGVVGVVLADEAGGGHVPGAHRGLFAVELAQQLEQVGGFHELCFSLQVMQTRVQGIAFSRGAAISSPQSRQMP